MSTKRLISMAVAATAMLVLAACQTQETHSAAPGALPRKHAGITPQLNASTFAAHGELLERRGELARAVEQYRKALELSPEMASVRNRLGVTLNKLGMHREATAEFRRALLKQPTAAHVQNNLGFSLYLEGRYDEAEAALTRALELDPELRRARMNRGLVLAKLGQYDAAIDEFTLAVDVADAHFNVAVVQAETGDYAAAARSLEQALQHNPKLTAARDHLRQISRLAAAQDSAAVAQAEAEGVKVAAEQQRMAQVAAAAAAEAALADATPAGDVALTAAVDTPRGPASETSTAESATVASSSVPAEAPPEMLVATPVEPEPAPAPSDDYAWRLDRLQQRIGALFILATPTDAQRDNPAAKSTLMQQFDQLVADVTSGAPGAEQCLAEWEQRWGIASDDEAEGATVGVVTE